jgi:hypothetical protein
MNNNQRLLDNTLLTPFDLLIGVNEEKMKQIKERWNNATNKYKQ